ncbi:restriction endonuclease subunit S [Natronosalvus amylolyticus]|uniref:restriction endonuclease subunit S n=1 Tax=Natronosalvus amylolyticus TaxID=2961994 RepID=UPI0020C9DA60|nr:restriction endonuclease subunit S [Natronosalvus amylolyticus]
MTSEVALGDPRDGYEIVQLGPREIMLPEDWEIYPVKELFEIEKNSFDPSGLDSGSEVMLYSMPAYDSGQEPIQTLASEIGSKKYRVPKDTILFPKLNIRKRRFWRVKQDHSLPAICSTEYWPLLPKRSLELDFYHYYFGSYEFTSNPKVTSASSTNSHKRVKQSSFEKLRLPLPTLPEQRRIADILSTVDEQIQQTIEIIEKRGELRKGLLQELFHQGAVEHERILDLGESADKAGGVNTGMDQTTIGQIPESWETERLGELTENSAYGVNASAEEFDTEKPRYLRITDIADDGHLKEEDPKSISRDVSDGYELKPGDLVFARTGATVGKTLLYQEDHPEAAYAGYLIRFQFDQTRIHPKFAFYFTQTNNYDRWVSRITRQGAQENINTGEYSSILLPLPPIDEQKEIVSILETVDQNIEQERKTKKSLQDLKRGLMQDLLTGKVRVNTE